jgi:hypothetical protein
LGTPESFIFSAGAPKEARAIPGWPFASETICACAALPAARKKIAAAKVLHKLRKSALFTISRML